MGHNVVLRWLYLYIEIEWNCYKCRLLYVYCIGALCTTNSIAAVSWFSEIFYHSWQSSEQKTNFPQFTCLCVSENVGICLNYENIKFVCMYTITELGFDSDH